MPNAMSIPRRRADGSGDEVVGHALEEEHLHQVATLCPDGAGDTHLASPFSGEQNEDEEDQEDASRDRERAERAEHRHERVALRLGDLQTVLLDRLGLESQRIENRLELDSDGVGVLRTGRRVALVRDEDLIDLARPSEQLLCAA